MLFWVWLTVCFPGCLGGWIRLIDCGCVLLDVCFRCYLCVRFGYLVVFDFTFVNCLWF